MSLEDVLSFKKGSKFASLLFSAFFLFVSGSEKMTMSITMTISTCYISNIFIYVISTFYKYNVHLSSSDICLYNVLLSYPKEKAHDC